MGVMIDGVWRDQWYDTAKTGGHFVRSESQFRNWVTADGRPGPTGQGGFAAEPDRYHLYVSLACPWAHRTLIFRRLKGLEAVIGVTAVHPHMLGHGWAFRDEDPEPFYGAHYLYELYRRVQPRYSGRVTVPVLWDRQRETIVSNESAEIIRMLNRAFANHARSDTDYYPAELKKPIDAINAKVYSEINNGVYRCGFATEQAAYERACHALFTALDEVEAILARQRYLVGDTLTEADWRLFTTLVRFDAVYYGHFKANLRQIADYPNLSNYLRDLYQVPGIAETVNFDHIKQHYYYSHATINPHRIVPLGPEINLDAPHDRDRFKLGVKRP